MIKKAIVFLYSVIVVVLAVATFVENSYGTRFVTENVYHTAWFCALWAVLAVLSVVLFVVIPLAAGLLTRLIVVRKKAKNTLKIRL